MLNEGEIKRLIQKGAAEERTFGPISYVRLRGTHGRIERGTVIANGASFPGFPHIKRIFTLEKGLERNISSEYVHAEEKIDGYNLRCVNIGGEIYGLSRGGIIDAFSTEKLRELVPPKVTLNKMLCGEMIGNTPYTHPRSDFDVKYYVFDIYDLNTGNYLTPKERYAFLMKHGLEPAPYLGRFHKSKDLKKLRELVLSVNESGKEGIVFKSEDRAQVVKYVNPNADIEDIGICIKALFDMPTGHFNQRLLRSAMFVKEYGLSEEEYGKKLGKAVYGKFAEGLRMLEKDGYVYDEFEITVNDPFVWDELKSHMSKDVKLETVFERDEGSKTRIRFRKIYVKSSKRLKEFLNGKGITD